MPKDYTQRRNERWETVFPGIGLESILGRILRIAIITIKVRKQ